MQANLNREFLELNVINQTNVAELYRTFHPNTEKSTVGSATHKAFFRNDSVLEDKTSRSV